MNGSASEIRISDIMKTILKRRKLILLLAAAGLAVGILLSAVSYLRGEMSKEYAVTSSFAVTSTTQDGLFTSQTDNPNSTDIYLAENMVDSVIYVIKSDRTLDTAIGKLDLIGVSTKDINKNLTARQYNETQIVELTLYWRSAEEGVKILEAINAVAPAILIDTLKIGGVSVVNKPTARYIIGGNVNASLWVYMTVLGVVIGIAVSLLELFLRPTLINTEDVNGLLNLDLLTEIPEDPHWFTGRCYITGNTENNRDRQTQIQFSFLAHIIDVRLSAEKTKYLFIGSVCPDEGRSSVAAGLGDGLNTLEKKVLLVDLDVEQPELGSLFGLKVEYQRSLNALYRGEAIPEDVIHSVRPGFDVLPAMMDGQKLPTDGSMISLLKKISEPYDYVLIDSPAIRKTGRIMDMNQLGGKVLWLVRYDLAPIREIRNNLDHLVRSGISLLGCVVNAVPGEMIRFRSGKESGGAPAGRAGKRHGTDLRSILPVPEVPEAPAGQDILLQYIHPEDQPDDAPLAGRNSAGTANGSEPWEGAAPAPGPESAPVRDPESGAAAEKETEKAGSGKEKEKGKGRKKDKGPEASDPKKHKKK